MRKFEDMKGGGGMKHGKKPTAAQRELLVSIGLDWNEWLVVVNLPGILVIRHRLSGETRVIDKEAK